MDNQSVCRRSAGRHNTAGAEGGSESKWGLGVFHSILGNDLHYEASEHFTRAPERAVVGAVLWLGQNETWRHTTCRVRTRLKRSIWNRYPKPTAASPPLSTPWVSVIFTETGAKCFKRGDGNRPGGGFGENVIIIRKMQWDQECLMHKCTKSDILLQLEGFQKLLEKAGKCVWDGDSERPV